MTGGIKKDMYTLVLSLPPQALTVFQFLLEGYEGLAAVTTIDPRAALVRIMIPAGFLKEATAVIENIRREITGGDLLGKVREGGEGI